jgi:hypothetical protein
MVLGIWHPDRYFVHLAKYHFFSMHWGPHLSLYLAHCVLVTYNFILCKLGRYQMA